VIGVNKELKPLVRQVRQAGGDVEVTRSGHALWTLPDGTVLRTGITMSGARARNAHRDITRALAVSRARDANTNVSESVMTMTSSVLPVLCVGRCAR